MDKTLRPDSKTIRATERKSNVSPTERTLRPNEDRTIRKAQRQTGGEKTARTNEAKTLRKTKQQSETAHTIQTTATEFTIKNKPYTVVNVISEGTGEAQIYLVEHEKDQSVLKLYYPNLMPPPNFTIIESVKSYAETGSFVQVFDCGEWIDPATGMKRIYELMEYCTGGSLEQLNVNKDEKLIGEIALQCGASIQFLNSKGVIHRDIKPANFFFADDTKGVETLRLADFGIAINTDKEGIAEIKADSQLRTPVYTAPEYYYTIDGKIQFDYKSDFYSLGMMLLVLWDGEKIFTLKEYELRNLKIHGNLPYPTDISDRTLQLFKALTDPDPRSRADYHDIIRWVKGENIYELKEKTSEGFNILFDPANNLTATSAEELGQFMYDNQGLAAKYLYSGKIAEWLTGNKRPDLAVEMEDIVENQFPKDKEAGTLTACFFLNMIIPYYDVNNRPHSTPISIAQSLNENAEYYAAALANNNDRLFLFLSSHGSRNLTERFAPLFKKKNDNIEPLRQLIYTLNPQAPWILTNEDNKAFECHTIDDVINANYKETLSDESWKNLLEESFLLWVRNQNPAVEGRIRSQEGHDENAWCVLYYLSPKVSYNLSLEEDSDTYFFTSAEIGEYMNNMIDDFIHDAENSEYASEQLDMMCDIDDTRLYYYLKSKVVYDDKIEWIRYCADVNSVENAAKYAPYNWKTGVYKSIKGLGYDPYYYFPESDEYIYNLEELNDIPNKEVEEELENGFLKEWIALFFQENPDEDLSEKYTFESLTVDYIDFISQYSVNDVEINDYHEAVGTVQNTHSKLKRNYRTNLIVKIVMGILSLMAVGFVSYKLLISELAFNTNSKWLYIIPLIIGYAVGRYRYGECLDSFVKSFLIGLGSFIGISLIVSFSISYPAYLLSGLLIAGLIWVAIICYIRTRLHIRRKKHLFKPGFEELSLEPLHYGFVADEGEMFESSIGGVSLQLVADLRQNTKKVLKNTAMLILLSIFLFLGHAYLSMYVSNKQTNKARYEALAGEYKGIFDNRDAVFTITDMEEEKAKAEIEVRYKSLITEKLKGEINIDTRSFHFDDINRNNNQLDGEYNGSFNDDFSQLSGTYKNYTTRKEVEFKFNK